MYQQYWNLERKPFEGTAHGDAYYPSETHHGALLKLRYTVEDRRGGAALSGSAGTGKSLVIGQLLNGLDDEFFPRVHVVFPQMPADQLMAFIASEVAGVEPPGMISESIQILQSFLSENKAAGRHAVLAVDEAHLIRCQETLEALRMLTNFQTAGQPNATLLMTGQPQMLATLERTPLGERVDVRTLLRSFDSDETASYVNHRLQAAGAERAIFDDSAIDRIFDLSFGIPRKINRLCDLALLIGFADEKPAITGTDIESVSEEMVAVAPE